MPEYRIVLSIETEFAVDAFDLAAAHETALEELAEIRLSLPGEPGPAGVVITEVSP